MNMTMIKPTLCVHHHPCSDWQTAAWAVWKRCGDSVKFHPGVHGQPWVRRVLSSHTPAPVNLAVADVNGDGRPDLIVANQGSNDVSILLNTKLANGGDSEPGLRATGVPAESTLRYHCHDSVALVIAMLANESAETRTPYATVPESVPM